MEKINKEELMKKLSLTEEELDKVADGSVDGFFIAGYCSQVCIDKVVLRNS